MKDLPIHPDSERSSTYSLEGRLEQLKEKKEEHYASAMDGLRLRCATDTLKLTGVYEVSSDSRLVVAQLKALSMVEEAAESSNKFTLDLIREVHRVATLADSVEFRKGEQKSQFRNARSSPARFIPDKLENLIMWLSGESGRQMFVAERMALWLSRFLEIEPFENSNFRTGHLFINMFAKASGYPPVSFSHDEIDEIREEIERAIIFDTGALVERFVGVLSESVHTCESALSETAQ